MTYFGTDDSNRRGSIEEVVNDIMTVLVKPKFALLLAMFSWAAGPKHIWARVSQRVHSRARHKHLTTLKKLSIKNALILKIYAKFLQLLRAFRVNIKSTTALY